MCTVRLISPSSYTSKADLLECVAQSAADLIVLPTIHAASDSNCLFEYPSAAELQKALKKGQKLFCQIDRSHQQKAPKNVILSRKKTLSLGRFCQADEINQNPLAFTKRLKQRRSITIRHHTITFLFEDEVYAVNHEEIKHIATDVFVYPLPNKPSSWSKLSRPLKSISKLNSVAMVALNTGSNPKTLNKIKTSIKLINQEVENTDAVQWDNQKKLFWLDIPLAD